MILNLYFGCTVRFNNHFHCGSRDCAKYFSGQYVIMNTCNKNYDPCISFILNVHVVQFVTGKEVEKESERRESYDTRVRVLIISNLQRIIVCFFMY